MQKYNPQKIEKKWQNKWDESETYKAKNNSKKPKYYCLIEFPYPSGAGLHVGHLRSHIAIDIVARQKRMSGYNVMYPIGWDAFGLPTENFAIKTKTHPKIVTENNIKNFTKQIKSYGPSFDWSREINTTDPKYYKWTQWIFLKLFNSFYDEKLDKARDIKDLEIPKNLNDLEKRKYVDNHRMAYEAKMAINWCPSCKIGLANEEVVDDACERCGAPAEKKMMKQWMLRITKYAERLIKDLETVDYLDKIKTQQINWIGRSEGATVKFKVKKEKLCLIIHGSKYTDDKKHPNYIPENKNDWLPWIKKQLEKNDITTYTPLMPMSWQPNYEDWKKQIEKLNLRINENSILIGHSAGGSFIVRWLGEKQIKINKLILIAPSKSISDENGRLKDLNNFKIDKNIKNLADEIMVFSSKDDKPYRIKSHKIYEKELDAKFIEFKNKGHFTFKYMKSNKFPELLEEILNENTKTPEHSSEVFDRSEDNPRCKTWTCHPNSSIDDNKKLVKSKNGAEPAEGLEPSDHEMTNPGLHRATGKSTPDLLYHFLEVFTTRPDTLFGCTYMVVAPEHSLITNYKSEITNLEEVKKYINKAKNKSDLDRTDLAKEKTGVELKGIKAINPVNNEEIPIWVADYVLATYGTGAIMAVPAHDERDFEFAKKYKIDIKKVITPKNELKSFFMQGSFDGNVKKELEKNNFSYTVNNKDGFYITLKLSNLDNYKKIVKKHLKKEFWCEIVGTKTIFIYGDRKIIEINNKQDEIDALKKCKDFHKPMQVHYNLWEMLWNCDFYHDILCFTGNGININSDFLNDLETKDAKEIVKYLEKNNLGKKAINYKLRDWVFSRQHYWGEPIPIVKCPNCGLKNLEIKNELNFYDNNIWKQIINGNKTIETRALNPEEEKRYFGDIKTGDLVRFDNKNTNDFEVVKIKKIYNFKNLQELFEKKDLMEKILPEIKINKLADLKNAYSFTKDYVNKIQKNGLVGWEFEIINTTKNISLSEKDLPLKLPEIKNYKPTDTGESPLAKIDKWVNIKCPKCKGNAKRETDTMPNWAGSSWYFLRYLDPKNNKEFASPEKLKHWMPVDLYNGGMEHTTLHLLYSRFWHKFLYDLDYVNTAEPYKTRRSHGMILAEDGQKMSKSRGNVVNPDEVIKKYGADTLRLYEMFMGPYSDAIPWSTSSLIGMNRFLERVWNMQVETRFIASKIALESKTILIATNNQGKLKELKDHLKNFNVISLKDVDKKIEEPEENGKTFADNSLIKAKYYAKKTGYLTIADDSGLCVNALDGKPGVYSSRYAQGDYKKANLKLSKELENKKDRSAYYQCIITLYNPENNDYEQFGGKCEGEIIKEPRGNKSFGYAPIFLCKELQKTFGECSKEERYRYNHRKRAADKLVEYLNQVETRFIASKFIASKNSALETLLHQTIKKITEDIENLKFNTAISSLMILLNELDKKETISNIQYPIFLILLSPFAPHITEEIWENLGNKKSIHLQKWPKYNPDLIKEKEITLVVQINGKLRDQIKVSADISEEKAKKISLESEKIKKWIEGKEIRKIIFVKGKLVNVVV